MGKTILLEYDNIIMNTAGNISLKIILITVILCGSIIVIMAQDEPLSVPPPAKKELPWITFMNLSPPYIDYDYFEGHLEYPFQVIQT